MKILIDTQVFLWSVFREEKIRSEIRELMDSSDVYLSSVSIYEIQLKRAIKKLDAVPDFEFFFENRFLYELSYTRKHALKTFELPFRHHDPFDRMLICQSMVENMPLVTADKQIQAYDFAYIPM